MHAAEVRALGGRVMHVLALSIVIACWVSPASTARAQTGVTAASQERPPPRRPRALRGFLGEPRAHPHWLKPGVLAAGRADLPRIFGARHGEAFVIGDRHRALTPGDLGSGIAARFARARWSRRRSLLLASGSSRRLVGVLAPSVSRASACSRWDFWRTSTRLQHRRTRGHGPDFVLDAESRGRLSAASRIPSLPTAASSRPAPISGPARCALLLRPGSRSTPTTSASPSSSRVSPLRTYAHARRARLFLFRSRHGPLVPPLRPGRLRGDHARVARGRSPGFGARGREPSGSFIEAQLGASLRVLRLPRATLQDGRTTRSGCS